MRNFVCAAVAVWLAASSVAMAQDALTLKERLSDKASDAQRVNNCKVPEDRRGPVPRPGCPPKAVATVATAPAGQAAAAASRR